MHSLLSRSRCIFIPACHDPHKRRVEDAAFYDKVCLGCHSPADKAKEQTHAVPAYKVSNRECVSCHMRKYEVPSMHTEWTDHRIGIQKEQFTETGDRNRNF